MDVAGIDWQRRERDHGRWTVIGRLRGKGRFILEVSECAQQVESNSRESTSSLVAAWFSAAGASLLVLHRNMARSGTASAEVSTATRRRAGSSPDAGKRSRGQGTVTQPRA